MAWTSEWTSGHTNFTNSEVYENAREIFTGLQGYGWTDEAIGGAVGNFQTESGGQFNPGQWQFGSTVGDWDNDTVGLGIGQWTPPSKLGTYCGGNDEAHCNDGDKQVEFVATNSGQWKTGLVNSNGYSSYYNMSGIPYFSSLAEYASDNTHTVEEMALAWAVCWERPGASALNRSIQTRQRQARYWYNEFANLSGHPIVIHKDGNGDAWASIGELVVNRAGLGDHIGLAAVPNGSDTFITWEIIYPTTLVFEEALTVANNYFTMPADRVELTAHFTGETPDPPPVPPPPYKYATKKHHMPIWMYPMFRV